MKNNTLKENINNFAIERDIDLVGFVSTSHLEKVIPTKFKPSRLWPEAKTIISIGKHILKGAIDIGTGDMIQNARWVAWRTNEMLNRRAMEIGHFIENNGAKALALSSGTMVDPDWKNMGIFGDLSHRHIAAEAGLGVIGVPTFCVTPQYGPRIYFCSILTDAELEPDPKLDFSPCDDCDECIKACPQDAIVRGRKTILKSQCIPLAMPFGVVPQQDYIWSILDSEDKEKKQEILYSFDFTRMHRALVHGVGTFSGCFFCIAACPVGMVP